MNEKGIASLVPATLNFVPTSWRISVYVEKNGHDNISLVGQIKLQRRQSVKLSTGEDIEELEGFFKIIATGEGELNSTAAGVLRYYENGYTMATQVSRHRFDILLAAVSRGRLPSNLAVQVEGMTCEGSSENWDNKNIPILPIASISIDIPLIGPDQIDSDDDSNPPTRAQFNKLLERLDHIRAGVVIAIIFLASLLWRGH